MFLFIIDTLLSKLEGNFFIENYPIVFNLSIGFIENLIATVGIFYLWKEENMIVGSRERIVKYLKSRSIVSWCLRVVIVLIISFIAYMIIGAIAYQLTGPYMEKLIKIPSMFENFSIQVLRGFAYIVVTIPIMIFFNKGKKSLLRNLIVINILLYPVLGYAFAYFFPPMFRLIDGTVLSIHMIIFSWLQVKFLVQS